MPVAGVTPVFGPVSITLYGTTMSGGASGTGTVFRVTPDGAFDMLHEFGPGEGALPFGEVTEVNGALYGTTVIGGRANVGVICRLRLEQ